MNREPTSRKSQILDALTGMLGQSQAGRITTAALAAHLGLSEAALYRHFDNKAALFDALITRIETQLLDDLGHIHASEPDGARQLHKQAHALLLFSERHPGLTKVLTGHALVTEDPRLHVRICSLIVQFEAILAQGACRISPASTVCRADLLARLLMHWVSGRWLRYVQSDWTQRPTDEYAQQLELLGLSIQRN